MKFGSCSEITERRYPLWSQTRWHRMANYEEVRLTFADVIAHHSSNAVVASGAEHSFAAPPPAMPFLSPYLGDIPNFLAPKAGSLRVLLHSPMANTLEVRFGPDLVSANAAPCSGSPGRVQIWFDV